MRRWLPLAAYLALAGVAATMALAGVGGGSGARAAIVATSGAFEISNSKDGMPIFGAAGIAPGGSASGTVVLADPGSDPVDLVLSRGALSDQPGLGGGVLSAQLQLLVADVTDPAHPRAVYEGPLATMPDQRAGRLEAGASRTFEFTATLPEAAAPSQNAVQDASATVAYSWKAIEATDGGGGEAGGGTPTPAPPPGTPAGSSGGAPTVPPAAETPPAPRLALAVTRVRRKVRGGRLVLWAGCQTSCRVEVRGRLRVGAGGRHRAGSARLAGRAAYRVGQRRLRIRVPVKLRRFATAMPGRARLRARLTFVARAPNGERASLRRTLTLPLRSR